MTIAFECNRCKKMSTNIATKNEFTLNGNLAYLIFGANDRRPFDLCDACLFDLEGLVKAWWNGILPE